MYNVNGVSYSEDSAVNQRIKDLFVRRNVCACVSVIVNYILALEGGENAPFSWDDVENQLLMPDCPQCGAPAVKMDDVRLTRNDIQVQVQEDALPEDRYVCSICGRSYPTQREAAACCLGEDAYQCSQCGRIIGHEELESLMEEQNPEILEWWIVEPWLCEKLQEHGEAVIPDYNIWGRTCSGQSISMDGVISDICEELEILEGQKFDWSRNFQSA